jgi:serum/glucocorticoid-regulated kinase 2
MRSIVEQLSFPSYVSSDARSLITSLLVFDPTLRLGHRGADEIKSHAFFATLDWSRMQRRLLAPPFVPSQTDVNASFIESAESGLAKTTRRTIRTDKTLERVSEEVFKNFSYTNPYAYQTELARSVHDRWQLIYGEREHPNHG